MLEDDDAESGGSGPKFRRRADERPDEILDAALALFAGNGYGATRIDDVAARAGISKGAVYHYFPSKRALLEGLIRRAVVPVAESVLQQMQARQDEPLQVLAALLATFAERMSGPTAFAVPRIVLREAMTDPEIAQFYRAEVLDRVLPALTRLLEEGMRQGRLRRLDPDLTVRTVVGPLLMHVIMAEVFDIRPGPGLALDRLAANHVAILTAGLAPEEAR